VDRGVAAVKTPTRAHMRKTLEGVRAAAALILSALDLGLYPPFELFVQSLDRIRCPDRFPLAFREPCESEELVACFLQAGGDGVAFQPPFADERLALRLDLRLRGGEIISL
jgi:hypothetical protein